MGSLSRDLWEMILMRLPLKNITAFKLVCKEWKSVVESPYFRERFMSHHQNSHSSWSLICRDSRKEVVAQYGCETWGLARSLGYYVYSFLDEHFKTDKETVRVLAYTDVGLILVGFKSSPTYYVANPISRECVKIPPRPLCTPLYQEEEKYHPGLVTRIDEKTNLLLGYKIVLKDTTNVSTTGVLGLLVYSSETGLWSYKTLDSQPLVKSIFYGEPITLNGTIYWSALSSNLLNESPIPSEILVSHDLYAAEDHHNRCLRVIQYPDDQCKSWKFSKSCTSSQGVIMYTSLVHVDRELKLRTWRLEESWEWQLVSDISPVPDRNYFALGISPFDANTIYMWNMREKLFASTNVYKRQFRFHNNLERTTNGRILHFAGEWDPDRDEDGLYILFTLRFVLPRWLHPIPSTPS